MTPKDALAERYGAPPRWRRVVLIAVSALVAVAFLGWLAWAMLFHSTPEAESELVSWDVVDEHTIEVSVRVTLSDDGIEADCRLRAFAEDHTSVGDLTWDPADSAGTVDELIVRTERRATSVELVGCTTPEQPRPR